jgi:hypothetical protein
MAPVSCSGIYGFSQQQGKLGGNKGKEDGKIFENRRY